MSRNKKFPGKLAMAIFADGLSLQVVCLAKQNHSIRLVDAEILNLANRLESMDTQKQFLSEQTTEASQEPVPIDITSETQDTELALAETETVAQNSTTIESTPVDSTGWHQKAVSETSKEVSWEAVPIDIELLQTEMPPDGSLKPIRVAPKPQTTDLLDSEIDTGAQDNASILFGVLSRFPRRKYNMAISLSEPQVYYAYFDTDWGLKDIKLKQKILEELAKERPDSKAITPDAVTVLKLADGKLMAIVREAEVGVITLLQSIKDTLEKRLPRISLVESAEISLVNLVKENYQFQPEEISVIVYIGHDFSRLIFMQGNELYHISPIIGEGIDSYLLFGYSLSILTNTIYSRLLLEQDDLNLPRVNNILLAGEVREAGLKSLFSRSFSKDVHIEEIKFPHLDIEGVDPLLVESLPQVAVALGAAWKALDVSNKELYSVNLIPFEIKEEQKVFKLGILGWIFLILIPLLTFSITTKISQLNRDVSQLQLQHQQKKSELVRLQDLQPQVEAARAKLTYYQKTFGVLDSMVVGTQTWSSFLNNVARKARGIEGVWLTEMGTVGSNKALLKGYSLYRNGIPRFSDAIGKATLKQVQVQEIREQTVYGFEIEAEVPDKKSTLSTIEEKKIEKLAPKSQAPESKSSMTEEDFKNKYKTALALFNQYQYQEAITQFEQLLKSPLQTELKVNCFYWIGESYFGLKNYPKAIEYFNEVVTRQSTKTPAALYMLGQSYAQLGKNTEARAYMSRVVTEYPESPLANKAKAVLEKL